MVPAIVAIAGALIAGGVTLWNSKNPAAPPQSLAVEVSPEIAAADEDSHFRVTGRGFTEDDAVTVQVSTLELSASVNDGAFATGFTVPAGSLSPGNYIVRATGDKSGQRAETTFTLS
jgi:hypothetical protein